MLHDKQLDEAIVASTIRRRTWPTLIWVPKLVRNVLIVVAVLTVLAALVLVAWRVPSALVIVVGGFALATLLSFPVRELCRFVPRRFHGLAVLTTFLAIMGLIVVGPSSWFRDSWRSSRRYPTPSPSYRTQVGATCSWGSNC